MKALGWVIAASIILGGCGSQTPSPVGSYIAESPNASEPAKLDIKADNTFVMSLAYPGVTLKAEGSWTYEHPALSMTLEKINDQAVSEAIAQAKQQGNTAPPLVTYKGSFQEDGKLLISPPNGQAMEFKRK